MTPAAPLKDGEIRELSRSEGYALLDEEAHRYLGISADQFIEMWRAGEFGDPDENPDVLDVAMLLPFVGLDPWSEYGSGTHRA